LEKREKELLAELKEEENLRSTLEKQQKEMRDHLEELKNSLKQEKALRLKEVGFRNFLGFDGLDSRE